MPDPTADEDHLDALCHRLAELDVPLFEPTAAGPPLGADEYATLIVALLRSGDTRLRLAVPCLLAAHDGELAATATAQATAMLGAAETSELGLLYRLARCLVTSRAPYMTFLFGRRPTLPPLSIEPIDVPDPSELHGERGLRFASETYCERGLPDLPGGAERQFDTWLDLVRTQMRRSEADRLRANLDLVLNRGK